MSRKPIVDGGEPTERAITGYHRDDAGDWVAELACGHNQHVRHRPPFQNREWVLDGAGRRERLGSPLSCPLCDRAELPDALRSVRSVDWDETTVPAGLRRSHRLGDSTWGRIAVRSGRLRFRAATEPPIDLQIEAGSTQAIPPGVEHEVDPAGRVLFSLEFLSVQRGTAGSPADAPGEGGDPACWAGLICPECGGVAGDGGGHRPGCSAGGNPP